MHRHLYIASASASCLLAASAAHAIDKHWNVAGTGNWSTGANWSPSGVPGGADAVFIGDTLPAVNGWVDLFVNASVSSITITDGMVLDTNTSQLTVAGMVDISEYNTDGQFGYPSRLIVRQGPAATDCTVSDIFTHDGGGVELFNGATLRVNDFFHIGQDTSFYGVGTVNLFSDNNVCMRVEGSIGAGVAGLTINQIGAGRIDLDGIQAGVGTLSIATWHADGSDFSDLTINGDALLDAFDDDMQIAANCELNMNLSDGWSFGGASTLRFFGNNQYPGPAQINGGALHMEGSMEFSGTGAHGQFNCPVTLTIAADASLGESDVLEFNGSTVVDGGFYTLAESALLLFDGPTTVRDGTFATAGNSFGDGEVRFNGQTTWDGDISVFGIAEQNGNASVGGPSVITADVFDFDGAGLVEWSIGNSLTLDAASLEPAGSNKFDGEITVSGTFLAKLTVTGTDLGNWIMAGTLNLGGVGAILSTRVVGDHMRVLGDLNIDNRVAVTSNVTLMDDSHTTFADASSQLRLSAVTHIAGNAVFAGAGELQNAPGGTMYLQNNADLGAVGVLNQGTLHVGSSPGAAFVDRFTNAPEAVWSVEIGGHVPQAQHDLLFVLGGLAQLGGVIDVRVIDAGGGVFVPQPGDSFLVLRASAGMAGAFANDPVSYGSGNVYLWSVLYDESTVTLHLDEVVPCPADLNADGIVNGADLGILLAAWGPCKGCQADLDGDTVVGGSDLGQLLAAWGPCI